MSHPHLFEGDLHWTGQPSNGSEGNTSSSLHSSATFAGFHVAGPSGASMGNRIERSTRKDRRHAVFTISSSPAGAGSLPLARCR